MQPNDPLKRQPLTGESCDSDEFHRLLIEHSPYCIHRIDLKGRLEWINPAGLRMLNASCNAEVLGLDYLSLVASKDYERIHDLMQRAYAGESSEFQFEAVDGSHYESRFVPVYDTQGELVYLMGASQDISERVRAVEALRLSEERLKLALSAADMGVWSYDFASDRYYWSERTFACYGQDPQAFEGTREAFLDLLLPEDVEQVKRQIELASKNVRRFYSRHRLALDSGEVRLLESVGRSIVDEQGEITQLLGTVTDVTEKDEQDRQLLETQRLESLGIIAGGIAHDFNNLLVGVMGNVELAMEASATGSRQAKDLGNALRSAERAADLCKQMLSYAERGGFVQQDLDMAKVLTEIGSLVHSAVPKSVTIEYDLGEDLPPVWGEPTQLRQVLMNLIINAAESIGEEVGQVHARVGVQECGVEELSTLLPPVVRSAGTYVCIQIEDDGVGMTEDVLSEIFDPFFTTKATGRGLGLAAVLGHVAGHGGGLEVKTKPGEGTTFRVLLPAAKRASRAHVQGIEPDSTSNDQCSILMVDDESIVRRFATRALESAGHRVTSAKSGRLGVAALEGGLECDLVLLDYSMHGMNGLETLVELRKLRPELPVILSSGYLEEDIISKFERFENVTFLHKPYHLKELLQTLQEVLGELRPPKLSELLQG